MYPNNSLDLQLHVIGVFMYELKIWYLKNKSKSNACEVLGGGAFAWSMKEDLGL